jgi:cobalamin biosynthesis Co2+ chelatase CbiK
MDHPIFTNCIKSIEFPCSPLIKSTGFTPLMLMVMNTKKYPELNDLIVNFKSTVPTRPMVELLPLMSTT